MTTTATAAPSGDSGLRETPLAETHRKLGAHFTSFAGWNMPVRYSSEIAEHHAVRTAAGLFDLSHMGELEITGSGAGAALDFAVVGKPSAMKLGQARYTMICDDRGGILDDLVIYRLDDDRFLVVANAGNVDVVREALLERFAGTQGSVRDASTEWSLLALQGPLAAVILAEQTDADLGTAKYYTVLEANVCDQQVLLARTGYTGEDGFEIYCTPSAGANIWTRLMQAGSAHGLVPAGLACRDTLRLEAGMPLYGQELSTTITPFEAGLGRVVNFNKPEGFVGEAALEQRRDNGVSRVLVGLASEGRRAPRTGYSVVDPATSEAVGTVTSGAPSPTLGHPIAIALVSTGASALGTRLEVDVRGSREPVEVVPLPFYSRARD